MNTEENLPIEIYFPGDTSIQLLHYYDEFIWWLPYSELESKWVLSKLLKPDWNVIDIGANVGMYTKYFSKKLSNGIIYAIEPTDTYNLLVRNLGDGFSNNVILSNLAIGQYSVLEDAKFWKLYGLEEINMKCQFQSLETYVEENQITKLDMIKIDTDGYEESILKGSAHVLKRFAPLLLIESDHDVNSGQNFQNIREILSSLEYQLVGVYDGNNCLYMHRDNLQTIDRLKLHTLSDFKYDTSSTKLKEFTNYHREQGWRSFKIGKFWLFSKKKFQNAAKLVLNTEIRNSFICFSGKVIGSHIQFTIESNDGRTLLLLNLNKGNYKNFIVNLPPEFSDIQFSIVLRSSDRSKRAYLLAPKVSFL